MADAGGVGARRAHRCRLSALIGDSIRTVMSRRDAYVPGAAALRLAVGVGWVAVVLMAWQPGPAGLLAAAGQAGSGEASMSVLDGVFTAGQASRGERRFQQACAVCHRSSDFAGNRFRVSWINQTVFDLYDLIANTMPDGNPGSLSLEEYVDIVAFFLEVNEYRAGETELPFEASALRGIRIEAIPAP